MRTYRGWRDMDYPRVEVDGYPLPPRFDLAMHSPDGFEWGYGGSGPAQLALAILADHCGSDEGRALRYYQAFKRAVIANLPEDEWQITSAEVEAALAAIESEEAEAGR